jgi:poly(hydroxyalkanoate) granule-associated protein
MTKKSDPLGNVKASARKIWLAGMGALSQAEKEGDSVFSTLVKKGREYEGVLKENVESASEVVRESVTAAKKEAGRGVHIVESAFNKQLSAAMDRLGIASSDEVDALRSEVERLRARLAKKKAATRKKSGKTKTTKKAKKSTTARKKPVRTTRKSTRTSTKAKAKAKAKKT